VRTVAADPRRFFPSPRPWEEERGRIYHEILKREEKEGGKVEAKAEKSEVGAPKEEPIVTALPHKRENTPPAPEDDDAWGAIPAFLRRHKK